MEIFQTMDKKNSTLARSQAQSLPHQEPVRVSASASRRVPVSDILGEEREVLLIHNGEAYRLRITANNKLILTK